MTRHGPALLVLSVLAIAGWTYNVNYDTRAALDRLSELRAQIAEEREALQVLRVEWAWLNAPGRLTTLLAEHNERLALVPMSPEVLGYVAAVPYPPDLPTRPLPPVDEPEAMIAAAPQAPDSGAAGMTGPGSSPSPDPLSGGLSDTLLAAADRDAAPGKRTINAMPPPPRAKTLRLARQIAGADAPRTPAAGTRPARSDSAQGQAITLASAPAPASQKRAGVEPQLGQPVPAAAQKAAVLTQPAPVPSSMKEAVAMALAEAGVIDADAAVAIIPASAPAAGTVTRSRESRPAVWVGR